MKSSVFVLVLSVAVLAAIACSVLPSAALSFHLFVVGANAIMGAIVDGALGEIAGELLSRWMG